MSGPLQKQRWSLWFVLFDTKILLDKIEQLLPCIGSVKTMARASNAQAEKKRFSLQIH
jgi:hypothetical protein